jgi:hypothetical protein
MKKTSPSSNIIQFSTFSLSRVCGRVVKLHEFEDLVERRPVAVDGPERFLDRWTEVLSLLREPCELLENDESFAMGFLFLQRICQQFEQGVGARPLVGLSKPFGDLKKIACGKLLRFELAHPARFEILIRFAG